MYSLLQQVPNEFLHTGTRNLLSRNKEMSPALVAFHFILFFFKDERKTPRVLRASLLSTIIRECTLYKKKTPSVVPR